MDVDIPGSYVDPNMSMELSTPIKKIKNLTLDSPLRSSPLYPQLDDIDSPNNMVDSMLNRGYSQRLTNSVLNELNLRATEISKMIKSPRSSTPTTVDDTTERRNKRYSSIHRSKFNKMESISNHYATLRRKTETEKKNSNDIDLPIKMGITFKSSLNGSPQKDINFKEKHNLNSKYYGTQLNRTEVMNDKPSNHNSIGKRDASMDISSITKRRRTLNGPEEVLNALSKPSPDKTKSSPLKKLSPSKKSFNLNKLLNESNKENFIKPNIPSNKTRPSSLELAGVRLNTFTQYQNSNTPLLQKKSLIPQLQKKSSIPQLQKQSSIPQLQKKPSLSQLKKKSSIPQLQKNNFGSIVSDSSQEKASLIPLLQKKNSIPQLQRLDSFNRLNNSTSSSQSSNLMEASHSTQHPKNSNKTHCNNQSSLNTGFKSNALPLSSTYKSMLPSRPSNNNFNSPVKTSKIQASNSSKSLHGSTKNSTNFTIPQAFSLYDKPTISSSQKSLGKFQKFKNKFN